MQKENPSQPNGKKADRRADEHGPIAMLDEGGKRKRLFDQVQTIFRPSISRSSTSSHREFYVAAIGPG